MIYIVIAVQEQHELIAFAGIGRAERRRGGAGGNALAVRPENGCIIGIARVNVMEAVRYAVHVRLSREAIQHQDDLPARQVAAGAERRCACALDYAVIIRPHDRHIIRNAVSYVHEWVGNQSGFQKIAVIAGIYGYAFEFFRRRSVDRAFQTRAEAKRAIIDRLYGRRDLQDRQCS